MPHAILVHGQPGIGKRELAEHFARFLLCEDAGKTNAACGQCTSCRLAIAGNHPDLRWVEPESLTAGREPQEGGEGQGSKKPSTEIKVEQVRELADYLYSTSHRRGYRVVVIHPAEAMNTSAANALLKGLEEPPAGVVFVLVSHAPARLLPTVRSRCRAHAARLPDREDSLRWLAANGVDRDAGTWLDLAGGAPRLARDYALGPDAETRRALREAVAGRNFEAMRAAVRARENLEVLVDVTQRFALDQACREMGARPRFGTAASGSRSAAPWRMPGRAWLHMARNIGELRRVATHPVNVGLFVDEFIYELDSYSSK